MASKYHKGDKAPSGVSFETSDRGTYFAYEGSDSDGTAGKWHHYVKDGKVTESYFIKAQAAPAAPAPAADPAPAAAEQEQPPEQGAPEVTESTPQETTGTPPGPPDTAHEWKWNPEKEAYYYVDPTRKTDSEGSPGTWHVYEEGTEAVFIADPISPETVESAVPDPISVASSPEQEAAAQSYNDEFTTEPQADVTGGALAPDEGSSTDRSAVPEMPTGGNLHTVVHGDTMWDIAQANSVSLDQLKELNPQIQTPDLIFPGQQINLGEAGTPTTEVAAADADASAAFPTTSSYDSTSTDSTADPNAAEQPAGWADSGTVPPDPAQTATEVSSDVQTDPLKIDENKQQ